MSRPPRSGGRFHFRCRNSAPRRRTCVRMTAPLSRARRRTGGGCHVQIRVSGWSLVVLVLSGTSVSRCEAPVSFSVSASYYEGRMDRRVRTAGSMSRMAAGAQVRVPVSGTVRFAGRVPGAAGGTVLRVTVEPDRGAVTLMPLERCEVDCGRSSRRGRDGRDGRGRGRLVRRRQPHLHLGLKQGRRLPRSRVRCLPQQLPAADDARRRLRRPRAVRARCTARGRASPAAAALPAAVGRPAAIALQRALAAAQGHRIVSSVDAPDSRQCASGDCSEPQGVRRQLPRRPPSRRTLATACRAAARSRRRYGSSRGSALIELADSRRRAGRLPVRSARRQRSAHCASRDCSPRLAALLRNPQGSRRVA